MDWLHRVGMILNFLSFWFAAPELLGEDRMKKWEGYGVERVVRVRCLLASSMVNEHRLLNTKAGKLF